MHSTIAKSIAHYLPRYNSHRCLAFEDAGPKERTPFIEPEVCSEKVSLTKATTSPIALTAPMCSELAGDASGVGPKGGITTGWRQPTHMGVKTGDHQQAERRDARLIITSGDIVVWSLVAGSQELIPPFAPTEQAARPVPPSPAPTAGKVGLLLVLPFFVHGYLQYEWEVTKARVVDNVGYSLPAELPLPQPGMAVPS